MRTLAILAIILVVAFTACSTERNNEPEGSLAIAGTVEAQSATATAPPVVVIAAADIDEMQEFATTYGDELYGSWPNIDAATERWADDMVTHDPVNDEWVLQGADLLVPLWNDTFAPYFPNAEWAIQDTYLSVEGAAYRVWNDLWPPWVAKPADPRTYQADQWHFDGAEVTSLHLWFVDETLTAIGAGCFSDSACDAELQTIIDTYTRAWESGDPEQISKLYAPDAVLADSMFGISATGADEVSQQAAARFGTGDFTIHVEDVYAQTNGFHSSSRDLDAGRIYGAGIHYRIVDAEGEEVLDSLTFFEMGTLEPGGEVGRAILQPDRLITREEVFHHHDSLISLAAQHQPRG
jgi:hypothetical protein